MNQPAYRHAQIIVAGANFACGSSREPAVYALVDAGYRCVIAPSFGDIFYSNCFRNGLLPIVLPADAVLRLRSLLHAHPGAEIEVNLETQTVQSPIGEILPFELAPSRRLRLLKGLDDIGLALACVDAIDAFEQRHLEVWPWVSTR